MPIRFPCFECRKTLSIAKRKSGTEVYCPICNSLNTVPPAISPNPVPLLEVPRENQTSENLQPIPPEISWTNPQIRKRVIWGAFGGAIFLILVVFFFFFISLSRNKTQAKYPANIFGNNSAGENSFIPENPDVPVDVMKGRVGKVESPEKMRRIIDRFILADTNQLSGSERFQAMSEFRKLNQVEAIPYVVAGINYSADIPASCPFIVLRSKLISLVSKCEDPYLLKEALKKLGEGVKTQNRLYGIEQARNICKARLDLINSQQLNRKMLIKNGYRPNF